MIKLILFTLLIVIGGVIVVARKFSSVINGQSQAFLIRKIKQNPAKASGYAEQLDMLMDKRPNINSQAFELIKSKIQTSAAISNYRILYAVPVHDRLLFFTEIAFTDFDVTLLGDAGDVTKKAQYNFLIGHNPATNELELHSTLYADLNEKLHKQGFIEALMKTSS